MPMYFLCKFKVVKARPDFGLVQVLMGPNLFLGIKVSDHLLGFD